MSNKTSLIETLENQAKEANKALKVVSAVQGTDNFIVVTLNGSNISAVASDGMQISSAVGALAAAIRSYSDQVPDAASLDILMNIVNSELSQISERAADLAANEKAEAEAAEEEEMEELAVDVTPAPAPRRVPARK